MKTVKCIKDTIGFKAGEVYRTDNSYLTYHDWAGNFGELFWDEYPEYFQEVTEEPVKKPKWKVGDKVATYIKGEPIHFGIVEAIKTQLSTNSYSYYLLGSQWSELVLRDLTPEELSTYFN